MIEKNPSNTKHSTTIDELMELHEEKEYNLIQEENEMAKVVHQFKTSGFEPYVRYVSGMVCSVMARFEYKQLEKTVLYKMVAQNLPKQSIHTQVVVSSEEKYNRMVAEMFKFNKSLFVETQSKYNEDTVRILDECRTMVPSGYFEKDASAVASRSRCDPSEVASRSYRDASALDKASQGSAELRDFRFKKLTEIDMNKAFSNAFQNIKYIPTLSAFDIWMRYKGEDISKMSKLTMYYVEAFEGNIFFNRNLFWSMDTS